MKTIFDRLREEQPQFFSAADITVPPAMLRAAADLVAAIESVVELPAYREKVLEHAPAIARRPVAAHGVFMGYDFHFTAAGPKLIEINTNAGGGLLNAYLLASHGRPDKAERVRDDFFEMFLEEWRAARGDAPLRRVAIVDSHPEGQFLYREFQLFRELFEAHGIAAIVADPGEFSRDGERLLHRGEIVDLVYNRLTDFSFDAAVHADLKAVFEGDGAVVTPHPPGHALYADKRNLMILSDESLLIEMGVPEATRQTLLAGIPRTVTVGAAAGDTFWAERKRWFFKPVAGFGSRAAYRGDKLTRRVFEEILRGGYVAQEIAPPSEHDVPVGGEMQRMKADIRAYVYRQRVQLFAARVYQGQTTNFRTPGGGFAPVFAAGAAA